MRETLNNIIYMAQRFKLATAFNMIGLVVSFATFFLLMTQVNYQRTYNQSIDDSDRLYRLESNYFFQNEVWQYSDYACAAFGDALSHMPRVVESYSLMRDISMGNLLPFKKGNSVAEYQFTLGNNTVVSALTHRVIDGEIEWTDDDKKGFIIPASIARDYFGTTRAAGKNMLMCYTDEQGRLMTEAFKVRGVFDDFPDNSDLPNCIYGNMGGKDPMPFNGDYKCYVKFSNRPRNLDSCAQAIKQAILSDINDSIRLSGNKPFFIDNKRDIEKTDFKLTALSKTYFESKSYSSGENGYRSMFYMLCLVAMMVIIVSTINFMNFTLAESPMRIRSLNTRLVLGASRRSLRLRVIAECVITAVTACIIAVIACAAFAMWTKSSMLFDGPLSPLQHPWLVLLMLAIAVLLGIVAGTYPAIFATSFPPAMALKGSFGLTREGNKLRTVLMFVQLFVTMFMASYFALLIPQAQYIYRTDYGFDKDRILTASLPSDLDSATLQRIHHGLSAMDEVERYSYSDNLLGSTDGLFIIKAESQGHYINYNYLHTDYNYVNTMRINIIEGKPFTASDTSGVIINEAARQQWTWLGIGDKISTSIEDGDSASIIGVCENVRYGTTHNTNNKPFAFILSPGIVGYGVLNIRVAEGASINQARRQIEALFNDNIPDGLARKQIVVKSFDDELAKTYKREFRFLQLLLIITAISLLITFIGTFCLSMFEAEQRRKEIAIRKIVGASSGEIVWMLCRRYGILVLISFVTVVPVAVFCSHISLEEFFFHTAIKWWVLLLVLALVGGIMLGTVALRGWFTARENPSSSIKTE